MYVYMKQNAHTHPRMHTFLQTNEMQRNMKRTENKKKKATNIRPMPWRINTDKAMNPIQIKYKLFNNKKLTCKRDTDTHTHTFIL